jgi:hypothetical protein
MSRDDLITFLKARLDDDEAHARNAFENDYADTKPEWSEIWSGTVNTGDELIATNDSGLSRHIERWDPKRVLAEVDAKRNLVELHVLGGTVNCGGDDTPKDKWMHYCRTCGSGEPNEYPADWPCGTLWLLAKPYADHPDYPAKEESWKP